jgi:hypothetical protein
MKVLPQIAPLLADNRMLGLVFDTPDRTMRERLLEVEKTLAPHIKDRALASASMAGLWLFHDFLDESHNISQDLHTAEGSFWHAILHRREPDYWNAKYWFRRVGPHPIGESLRAASIQLDHERVWPALHISNKWDATAFVDLCEKHADPNSSGHDFCRKVQQAEWNLLFEYCHDRAFN